MAVCTALVGGSTLTGAGSMAASIQTPLTAAGSWFAQSAGATGAAAAIGAKVGTVATVAGASLTPITLSAVGFGTAAIQTPTIAAGAGVGFGTAGVTAGSIVASIQKPLTAAGSWFAQSAGATGAAVGIGAKVGFGTAAIQTPTIAAGTGFGFGAAGVTVAGSMATAMRTLTTAGSLFALAQSAGGANGARVRFRVWAPVVGTTIAGALLAPAVLPALGFGAAGITAGSIAASIQTPLTVAGSWFAILQSAGATGAATCIAVKVVGAGVGAGIGAGVGAVASALS